MAEILPSVYKVGTATVAADGVTVTGQGTLWVKDVLPGDFFGVHKGLSIQIESVDSNGSLTLANPWPGAAQNAAPYAIMLQSDVARYSEALRQLLVKLSSGNVDALAGLLGAANKLPMFTGAGAMTTVDYANGLALGGLVGAADTMPYFTGPGAMQKADLTPYARSNVLNKADRAGLLASIGVSDSVSGLAIPSTINLNLNVTNGWVASYGGATLNKPIDDNLMVHVMAWPSAGIVLQTAYGIYAGNRRQWNRVRDAAGAWSAWVEQVQHSFNSVEQGGGAGQGTNKVRIGWKAVNDAAGLHLLAQVDSLNLGAIWTDNGVVSSRFVNGYVKFPNGIMLQWGIINPGGAADGVFVFPVSFAETWIVIGSCFGDPGATGALNCNFDQFGSANFVYRRRFIANGGAVGAQAGYLPWLAIGRWF